MIYEFEKKKPTIGKGTYVHESADIIGNVTIGEKCYIGPGARLRGDYGKIVIGSETCIEDNCVIHARPNEVCKIGDHVTVGHGSIIHNAVIRNWVVVGMGAIVSDYAEVGEWVALGEGCVVKSREKIPDNKIAVGVPAKVIGNVKKEWKELWTKYKGTYRELAERRYPDGLRKLE